MAIEITIPRLGWSMEEGTFAGWQKQDGASVKRGEVLFELEGEKALQEIEALDEGILCIPEDGPKPGAILKVGATIGFLLASGETRPSSIGPYTPRAKPEPAALGNAEPGISAPVPATGQAPAAAPSVRRLARQLGVELRSVPGTGQHGRIMEQDVTAAAHRSLQSNSPQTAASVASPRARRAARQAGLDWSSIPGTGRNGRVREQDVLNAAGKSDSRQTGVPLHTSKRRTVIAERLRRSLQDTVPVTITTRADATNMVSLRQQFKSAGQPVIPAIHDIVARLIADCLAEHPLLAARREDGRWQFPAADGIHLGLAVDAPDGLIVPVIRDVRGQSLTTLAAASARMIQRAREGRLSTMEMTGAVFTISNLGSLGIDAFTPVINWPESAILGLGALRREPVVSGTDQITIRTMITLSLTFDHCLIDGAPAARFLQLLAGRIENAAAHLI